MQIHTGLPERHRDRAAALYWQAFGPKLGRVLGPEQKALCFIRRVMDPAHAISAFSDDGRLIGVAGFKTDKGALVGGGLRDLFAVYGPLGAIWRAGAFAMLMQDTENCRFLMDGIFVCPAERGRGIGTALLEAVAREAHSRGYAEVRLDVIATNTRARALYERRGFAAIADVDAGWRSLLFGFESATTMVRRIR